MRRLTARVLYGLLGQLAVAPSLVEAQEIIPLMQFADLWRYDTSGADLGAEWRQAGYDDSAWPQGPGLLQTGEATVYPAPFRTVLPATDGKITYYFRARFVMPEPRLPFPALLIYATNLVDDGCVLYLNGVEAGRVRVPAGQNYLTPASAGPAIEGQLDVLLIPSSSLRIGENVVAVEVHQNSANSTDLVWGSQWAAYIPSPLVITREPVGITNFVGVPVALSVEVTGGPASYQWSKDGVKIPGATNAVVSIAGLATNSGSYWVEITNTLGRVTSATARVLIAPDQIGPTPLSAVVASPDLIDVVFDELVLGASVDVTNVTLTRLRNGAMIPLMNASSSRQTVRIRFIQTDDWLVADDYYLTLTGIRDGLGNVMAPGTRVPLSWTRTNHNVIGRYHPWHFHNSAVFDPGVYDRDWAGTNYQVTSWWGQGAGVMHHLLEESVSCFGGLDLDIGTQSEPILFRTTFEWRAGTSGILQPRLVIDDGAVIYLNGVEIYRTNQVSGPITALSRATANRLNPVCITNLSLAVTNLLPGTNWLAVALTESPAVDGMSCFAFITDVVYTGVPPLPPDPPSVLTVTSAGSGPGLHRLSWPGGGFALETATNLVGALTYPFGPWLEVSNMANPFVFGATNDPVRYFRLKKK